MRTRAALYAARPQRVKLLWAALQVVTQKRKLGVSLVCHGCNMFLTTPSRY